MIKKWAWDLLSLWVGLYVSGESQEIWEDSKCSTKSNYSATVGGAKIRQNSKFDKTWQKSMSFIHFGRKTSKWNRRKNVSKGRIWFTYIHW